MNDGKATTAVTYRANDLDEATIEALVSLIYKISESKVANECSVTIAAPSNLIVEFLTKSGKQRCSPQPATRTTPEDAYNTLRDLFNSAGGIDAVATNINLVANAPQEEKAEKMVQMMTKGFQVLYEYSLEAQK